MLLRHSGLWSLQKPVESSIFHDFEHEIRGKHHEEGETIEVIDKRERDSGI